MSDDENEIYSDDNSEFDNNSENEGDLKSKKKISLFKPSIAIKSIGETKYDSQDDSDEEEEEDEDDEDNEDEEQTGGVGDNGDELDIDDAEMDEDEEDEDSEDEDIELDEDGEPIIKESVKKTSKLVKPKKITQLIVEDEDEDEDDEYDNYLQKFDNEIIKNYVDEFHPECLSHNYDEIAKLSVVIRNSDNIIVDPLHRTIPYLTKYERARILGQRAKQIETGARPLVKIPENIVDSYIIAELELREKKIPFIIRRPIPGGACEYWSLRDLEVIAF
jgi:DNA-directed RNA polymerase I, II, and III subunit RPABC2